MRFEPLVPGVSALTSDQFFYARRQGNGFETRGTAAAYFGHRLEGAVEDGADGAFAEWRWTGSALRVRNDRYGVYPLYYYLGRDHIAIATSVQRLIEEGAPGELDEDALAVFLRLGNFIGDGTPFKAIRALPPRTTYTWTGQQEHPTGRLVVGRPTALTVDEAYEAYHHLFSAAVRRRCDLVGDVAVALSGGMDSRHILFELCQSGSKPKFCVTARLFRGKQSEDEELARQVTRAVGVEHVVLDQTEGWCVRERRKNLNTHLCALEHAWALVLADHLQGKVGAVFDGLGGDVLSDCRGILTPSRHQAFSEGRFATFAAELCGPDNEMRFLAPSLRRRLSRERAISHLVAELKRHADAPNPMTSFHFWNRTRRTVALTPYGILNASVHVLTPYLDHALFDFLVSLPAEMLMDYTFHAETIRRSYPGYPCLPYFTGPTCKRADVAAASQQVALEVLRFYLKRPRSAILSTRYFLPRLLRNVFDRSYTSAIWWLGPLAVYGLQLEEYSQRAQANFLRSGPTES